MFPLSSFLSKKKKKKEGYTYVYIGIKSLSKESQDNGKKWFHLDQDTRGSGKEEDFLKNTLFFRTILGLQRNWEDSAEAFPHALHLVSPIANVLH